MKAVKPSLYTLVVIRQYLIYQYCIVYLKVFENICVPCGSRMITS